MSRRIEVGERLGKIVVLAEAPPRRGGRSLQVRCDCGETRVMLECNLRRPAKTEKSCGCTKYKHGLWRTLAYESWSAMMSRCYKLNDNKYRIYGARGIKVCDRWHDFANFFADMGERAKGLSLDRINVDGNYEPGNCRWATAKEQGRNTRFNRLVSLNGETKSATQWAEERGLSPNLVLTRLRHGWEPARAINEPVRKITRRQASRGVVA